MTEVKHSAVVQAVMERPSQVEEFVGMAELVSDSEV
jgi:hypothetical protein